MERIVQLEHNGRRFVFRIEECDGVDFWTVESGGRTFKSAMAVSGDEIPDKFFPALAKAALDHFGA